jgi:hypothetical protein
MAVVWMALIVMRTICQRWSCSVSHSAVAAEVVKRQLLGVTAGGPYLALGS